MSTPSITFASVTALALLLAACDSPEDAMKDAEAARLEAKEKKQEATAETSAKVADVRNEAAEETADIKADGAKKVNAADEKVAAKEDEATDALRKARADVEKDAAKRLDGLDKEIIELRAKLEKKVLRTESDSIITNLKTQSGAARRSNESDLASSTVASLDAVKKGIDARLVELEKAIAEAKKRT